MPYDVAALEPVIDAQTMEIHHGKHHQAYVDNLNKVVADRPDIDGMPAGELNGQLDLVPEDRRTAVRNNGGGHVNHTMFWESMTPGGGEPARTLADAIAATFGDLTAMQEAVNIAGLGRFGSGWAWRSGRNAGHADPRYRCPGTRLLPGLPEPPRRLPRRLVKRRQPGGCRSPL